MSSEPEAPPAAVEEPPKKAEPSAAPPAAQEPAAASQPPQPKEEEPAPPAAVAPAAAAAEEEEAAAEPAPAAELQSQRKPADLYENMDNDGSQHPDGPTAVRFATKEERKAFLSGAAAAPKCLICDKVGRVCAACPTPLPLRPAFLAWSSNVCAPSHSCPKPCPRSVSLSTPSLRPCPLTQPAYAAESIQIKDAWFHKTTCMKCAECGIRLNLTNYKVASSVPSAWAGRLGAVRRARARALPSPSLSAATPWLTIYLAL